MKLQLKRSNVLTSGAAKVPTASQLEYGELAINYNDTDPAIFLKDSNNNVIRISGVGNIADDGQVELPASTTPPLNPEAGNLWFNSDEGRLYIYYVDTDTSQWVDASPDSYDPSVVPDMSDPNYQAGTLDDRYNSSQVGTTAPAVTTRQEGALWWNSNNNEGKLYVLYNDPAPDGRKKWVEASPYPDTSGFIRSNDNGTQQNIIGGGGLTIDGNVGIGTLSPAGALHVDAVSGVDGPVFDSGGTANANHALLVRDSANNQLLRVNNNGNIGIGTTSPGALLDLGTATPILRFSDTDTTGYHQIQSSNANFIINADPSNATANSSISFNVDGDERMRINSSGNVGIGTTLPQRNLHIHSSDSSTNTYLQLTSATTGSSSTDGFQLWAYGNGGNLNAAIAQRENADLEFWTNNTERLRIDSFGFIHQKFTSNNSSTPEGLFINNQNNATGNNASLIFSNDSGNRKKVAIAAVDVGNYGASDLVFALDGTDSGSVSLSSDEKMRIDSSGNVGIGETSPGQLLHLSSSGFPTIRVTDADNSTYFDITNSDGDIILKADEGNAFASSAIRFNVDASERMRITSSGNVGIGSSNPGGNLTVTDASTYTLDIKPNGLAGALLTTIGGSASLALGTDSTEQMRITSGGIVKILGTSESLRLEPPSGTSYIAFWDGTTNAHYGFVGAANKIITGGSSSDLAVRSQANLIFSTGGSTERMRIASEGAFYQNSSSHGISTSLTASAGFAKYAYRAHYNTSAGLYSGTICYNVWSNGNVQNTNNSYGAISDSKLKENIVDASSQWDDIKNLRVRNYNFIEGQTHTQIGVVAQEVETVSPGLVSEQPDMDENDNDLGTTTKSVNYSVLYMKAVKALQEAMARIETLEQRLTDAGL